MIDDPLSQNLTLVDARSLISGGLIAENDWAVRFPAPAMIQFLAVAKGDCWLAIDGEETPVRLETGDVFLLVQSRSFVLASDPTLAPLDGKILFSEPRKSIVKLGDREDSFLLGAQVDLNAACSQPLLDGLPPTIHVRAAEAGATALQGLLKQLVQEREDQQPGAMFACTQLARLLVLQILRTQLATTGPMAPGWLRALSDPRLAPALRLMHSDPARSWRLEEFAKAAAMSRTTFALHFKTVAGVAPLAYLADWRMRLAKKALQEGNTPVSALARSLGYTSGSAFSNAFKRVTGDAPQRYRMSWRATGKGGARAGG